MKEEKKQLESKVSKDLNHHFSKEDIKMINEHMKRSPTLSIIREILIKITVRYHPCL